MATVKKMVEKKTAAKKVEKKVVTAAEAPKTTVKKAAAKDATVKEVVAKPVVAKKADAKVATEETPAPASREDRFRRIEMEAFLLAEKDNFKADPLCYWIAAEKKILQAAG